MWHVTALICFPEEAACAKVDESTPMATVGWTPTIAGVLAPPVCTWKSGRLEVLDCDSTVISVMHQVKFTKFVLISVDFSFNIKASAGTFCAETASGLYLRFPSTLEENRWNFQCNLQLAVSKFSPVHFGIAGHCSSPFLMVTFRNFPCLVSKPHKKHLGTDHCQQNNSWGSWGSWPFIPLMAMVAACVVPYEQKPKPLDASNTSQKNPSQQNQFFHQKRLGHRIHMNFCRDNRSKPGNTKALSHRCSTATDWENMKSKSTANSGHESSSLKATQSSSNGVPAERREVCVEVIIRPIDRHVENEDVGSWNDSSDSLVPITKWMGNFLLWLFLLRLELRTWFEMTCHLPSAMESLLKRPGGPLPPCIAGSAAWIPKSICTAFDRFDSRYRTCVRANCPVVPLAAAGNGGAPGALDHSHQRLKVMTCILSYLSAELSVHQALGQ